MSGVATITPKQLSDLLRTSPTVHVIDVRTPVEYQEVHLTSARNVPLDLLKVDELPTDNHPIVFVCKSGTRGRMACEKMLAARPNVMNLEGGTQAAVEAGLSVIRGKKAVSLERQVRIAAGSFVLLGVLLSWFHPYFIGLSAFVGAGLVFAGITDTCAMGMLLAKMPWNQVRSSSSGAACATP